MNEQDLLLALREFAAKQRFRGKGPLSVALVVTDHARRMEWPINPELLITEGGGQVLGLGKAKVQEILGRYKIARVLSEEAGRTSRGSIGNMRKYVDFLNGTIVGNRPDALLRVERFWIDQVNAFFQGKPFALTFDATASLRTVVTSLLSQAEKRQKEMPGTTYMGTMLQHLVGAKLELIMGVGVRHESASASDESTNRGGDFIIDEAAIHVTTTPGEALLRKCKANIQNGLRPVIVTTRFGSALADLNAKQFEIQDQIEIIEIEQWIASNILEWGRFESAMRRPKVSELIEIYNNIVDQVETDPSLRIEASTSRG